MSLLYKGIQRVKAFVLILALAVAAVAFAPSASAYPEPPISDPPVVEPPSTEPSFDGITVSETVNECYSPRRVVTNNTSGVIQAKLYFNYNGLRREFGMFYAVQPGESKVLYGESYKYFQTEVGVKVAVPHSYPNTPPQLVWRDLGVSPYVSPESCSMVAPAKITKLGKTRIKKERPIIRFKTVAYWTDFGYMIQGKSKRIIWGSHIKLSPGKYTMVGPRIKPGKKVTLKFFSRNSDFSGAVTEPTQIGAKKYKRIKSAKRKRR